MGQGEENIMIKDLSLSYFEKMTWSEKLQNIQYIKNALVDEKSKILFDARVDYMIDGDMNKFYNTLSKLNVTWSCLELLDKDIHNAEFVIFGCGEYGKKNKRVLEFCGLSIKCFCDSNYYGSIVEGIPVISVDEMIEKCGMNDLVIIGSLKYGKDMVDILLQRGYPENKIVEPKHSGVLWGMLEKQYFDYFDCEQQEVYVDAGAYDGSTVMDFLSWTKGNYKKIFVCEPLPHMYRMLGDKFRKEDIHNIILSECAVWDKEEKLNFYEDREGSCIKSQGTTIVDGRTIDGLVGSEEVTYIKMDIEGSELRALKGAKNTILRCKPKLAICIYHKSYDVIELALYILSLVPEYKLGIRHYATNICETVLYANI